MKHLLFALLFITSLASAQTADYTEDLSVGAGYANRTYTFAIGPDTLDATSNPDTLIIDFDQSFYGLMNLYATVKTDSLVVGGTVIVAGTFEFQQAQCTTCPFYRIYSSNEDMPAAFAEPMVIPSTSATAALEDSRLRLVYYAESGKSAIRTWLTLKPL